MLYEILNPDGVRVGEFAMSLHANAGALSERFKFYSGGWDSLQAQISAATLFPIAEFFILEVYADHRKRGYGRDAMRAFNALASEQGAKLGLLKVATQGEDYEAGIAWRIPFYRAEGWREFRRPEGPYWPHLMYHVFDECPPPRRSVSQIARKLDEFQEQLRLMRANKPPLIQMGA